MYGQEISLREQIVNDYRDDLEKLLRFLPYFDKKGAKDVQSAYEGEKNFNSIPVPVYDSTLLTFVKEVKKTKFVYRNYPYVFVRLRLKTPEDEINAIKKAQIRDIDVFRAIMSKYILGGQTKAYLWSAGVENRIYVTILDTLQKLFSEYDEMLAGKGLGS